MKILFVGASGTIGSGVLSKCLADPRVTTIIAFVRRELPKSIVSDNGKLQCVTKKDFAQWEDEELRPHSDAAAMIWAMGTDIGDLAVDFEYPLAFQKRFVQVLEEGAQRPRFRFILLSGMFVRQDQDMHLWFLEKARKMKGRLESETLALTKQHESVWQAYIARPGGVISNGKIGDGVLGAVTGAIGKALGKNWSITVEELGAFMTQAAVTGSEKDGLVENIHLVERGTAILKTSQ